MTNLSMARYFTRFALLGCIRFDHGKCFAFRGTSRLIFPHQQSHRTTSAGRRETSRRLHMVVEPTSIASLLLAADGAFILSDLVDQVPDVMGAAADLTGSASGLAGSGHVSVGESLSSVGDFFGSIANLVTDAKDQPLPGVLLAQVSETSIESVGALKSQVGDLGTMALSPFQRLGEGISNTITGSLDTLTSGARSAVEGAQTQLDQSVQENIGNPLQESMSQVFSKFGTSPEELLKEEKTWTGAIQETIKSAEKVATPSTLFYAENAAILPLWAGMIIWPEKPLTKAAMSTYTPVVLAAIVYFWLTYECFQNPVSLQGFASGITDLGGLTKGFGEEISVATAWSHFLAEDLFIGRWVYLDGRKNGIFTRHSLALCYLFGPVGFLSHLLTRKVFAIVKPDVQDIMEAGVAQQIRTSPKPSPKPSRMASPKPPPKAPPTTPPSGEAAEIVAKARREAEAIIYQARTAGAAQAASLLEAAETEALDILKGAEVERSALLKVNTTEPTTKVKIEPAAGVTTPEISTGSSIS